MDSNESSKVIAFDTLFSTNHIQMLKVMLPYMDNQSQKSMAIYIKFLELNYTIDFYKKHPFPVCGCMERESEPDFSKICGELLPYCTEKEKKQLTQIRGIFQSMETYQEVFKTMELLKDIMPDMGEKKEPSDGFGMMEMLMNMLTPEQKEMFQLFGGNQHDE